MLAALAEQLAERGERMPDDPPAVTRMVLDSLACRYASVLRAVESLTGRPVTGVHVVGGGSRNRYLNQATATATDRPVLAGPVEATVVGNLLAQAIAAGRFASSAEARAHVARHVELERYEPRPSRVSEERARRYAELEALAR
jgi:rhamnulokinase